MSNFVRNGWSFRRGTQNARAHWSVFPKGERCHWSIRASISLASDDACHVISMNGFAIDARATFEAAIELVLSRLGTAPAR